jgi:hypothetical protein
MPSFAPVLGLLGITGLAAAHGFVDNATIGGLEYEVRDLWLEGKT